MLLIDSTRTLCLQLSYVVDFSAQAVIHVLVAERLYLYSSCSAGRGEKKSSKWRLESLLRCDRMISSVALLHTIPADRRENPSFAFFQILSLDCFTG